MLAFFLGFATCLHSADWPDDWPVSTPESQGVSTAKLDVIKERLAAKKTRAFLVVRNDHIILEWYAEGVTAGTKQGTASVAKALVGGMSLAVAMTDGLISIDDPVAKYVPQWKDNPRNSHDGAGRIDTRSQGGLAIYDAPEPWGPCTTAYFTGHWDVGPGDSASFPSKWISSDGKTLYLVFSGGDSFSVRQATLEVASP